MHAIKMAYRLDMKKARTFFAAVALLSLAACGKHDDFNNLPAGELFKPLSLQAHNNPTWAASSAPFEREQNPARWSPYVWASNASALQSIANDKQRLDSTIKALLDEMSANSIIDDEGNYRVIYRYPYVFDKYPISAPWYSAFGNASIAVGLMHIRNLTGDTSRDWLIDDYLNTVITKYSYKTPEGNTWFAEYVSDDLPNGHVSVINGHFFVIAAMYEWRNLKKTDKYDKYISAGLDTMRDELPKFIQNGYFSYADGFPHIKDYGQQRAVNFAAASCELRDSICPIAVRYQKLFNTWPK
ncbi:D-glucuronyl C5-epimerase family protein [Pseudomonas asiatica]|uniref:D-glucuronyl C5-epimerase family protein n=1 Tax=Pseudomonas asiatica TaxID=2219225 RepID=UPI002F8E3BBA